MQGKGCLEEIIDRRPPQPTLEEGMFYLDTLIVWALAGRRNQTRLIRLCIIAGMEH